FTPALTDVRSTQSLYEIAGFVAKFQLLRRERFHLFAQFRVRSSARLFQLANFPVYFFERIFQRLDQLIDRLLSLVEFALGFGLKLFKRRPCEIEKFLIVVLERIPRERLEFLRKLFSHAFERLGTLLRRASLAFEIRQQPRIIFTQTIAVGNLRFEYLLKLFEFSIFCGYSLVQSGDFSC